jgi:hypothetical protein
MTRTLGCFAALVVSAFGSMPASATDQTMTIAMNEPMAARHVPVQPTLNPNNLRAAIEIDETNPDDYIYRALFQLERGELELALNDARKAFQLAPHEDYRDFRNNIEQRISLRSFRVSEATNAAGLKDGFSRVAYYR